MKLLIVESPGKIKKLQSFLGADWTVAASVGHVRDLPNENYGIEPPHFKPFYKVTPEKKDVVAKLKNLASKADEIFLASDPDREGEAIAWHLKDELKLTNYKRVTYTAITKEDVEAGIAAPRDIDMNLVHAQEARRSLDRIVGFGTSGPLSRALGEYGMSAGRVQSPAVRIVVDRENEIKNFVSTTHYGVELTFDEAAGVASGWRATWLPKENEWVDEANPYFLDKAVAERIAAIRELTVQTFDEKDATTAPPAPFTTSTLQQAASNALKFAPKKTMELAQKLYEAGHITYMRTDSPNLSESAIKEIRAYADSKNLPLPQSPRTWKSKDGAQEAHEAIRPTHIEVEEAGDTPDQKALYQLIRNRALASQLEDAVFSVRVARLVTPFEDKQVVFEAKGRKLKMAGWRIVLQDGDATEDEEKEPENPLPVLKPGKVVAQSGRVSEKKTKPKPRFKQATLIRELEKKGIGRPATYASILDNIIVSKKYLVEEKGFLVPTARGVAASEALTPVFRFMDLNYTKDLEDKLDDVATGKLSYENCIAALYDVFMGELSAFKDKTMVPCPECGNREKFYRNQSKDKKSYYWKCANCNNSFKDDNGRPGELNVSQERPLSDIDCPTCGKAKLARITGSKNGVAYDFFACSDKSCGAKFSVENDKPVERRQDLSEHKCPKCGKPLAKRPTKKGGVWYGCTGYPKCDARFWDKDGQPDFENPPK